MPSQSPLVRKQSTLPQRALSALAISLLAAALALAIAPGLVTQAHAASANVGDTFSNGIFSYTVTAAPSGGADATVALAGFKDADDATRSISIPATTSNDGTTYKVTSIAEGAFFGKTTLYYLDFSSASNLTTIGASAFASCGLLHDSKNPLTFPASLTTISGRSNRGAFQDNKDLKRIDLTGASSLKTIGACAFAVCGLDYPTDATEDGPGNPLKFSLSLTRINASAFAGNAKLCYVDIHSASSLTSIGDFAFSNCDITPKGSGILSIPSKVQSIGASAFSHNAHLTQVYLFDAVSLKTIGANAFGNCGLMSHNRFDKYSWVLTIPPFVEYIGPGAFGGVYTKDNDQYINTIAAVVFLGDKPPEIAADAFTSNGFYGGREVAFNVHAIYARNSQLSAFTAVPSKVQNGYDLPTLTGHETSKTFFVGTTAEYSVPVGTQRSLTFSVKADRPAGSAKYWCYNTLEKIHVNTETVIIDASLVNESTGEVAATTRCGFRGSDSSQTTTVGFASDTIAGLTVGSYKVMVHGVGMLDGFDLFEDAQVGTIKVTGQVQPSVRGFNAASVQLGRTTTFSATATLSGAAFVTADDALSPTCEIIDHAITPNVIAAATLSNVKANGALTFSFDAAATAKLAAAGAGTYSLRVTAPATTSNKAIAVTSIGTVTVAKAAPTLAGDVQETRTVIDATSFSVTATLADAFFATQPAAESLPVVGVLRDAGGSVVASAAASADANGDVALSFVGAALAQLAAGTYSVTASSAGSVSNAAIAETALGTLSINKAAPTLSGSASLARPWSDASDLSVSASLAGARFQPGESVEVSATLTDSQGRTQLLISQPVTLTANGTAQLTFAGADAQGLELGNYQLYAHTGLTASNEAVADTPIGTLAVEAWAPSLSADPVYAIVNHPVQSDLAPFVFTYADASELESQSVICELWSGTPGVGEPDARVATSVQANGDYPLTLPAAALGPLSPGPYSITLRADAANHTEAIDHVIIGTLVIGSPLSYKPMIAADLAKTHTFANTDDLTVNAELVSAANGENLVVNCELWPVGGAQAALSTTTTAQPDPTTLVTDGTLSFTFSGDAGIGTPSLSTLEPGSYEFSFWAAASGHNQAIPQTYGGTLVVGKRLPAITCGQVDAILATPADLPFDFSWSNSANLESHTATCELWSGTPGVGTPQASATTELTGAGDYQMTIPEQQIALLKTGTYAITLRTDESAHDQEIPLTTVGTLQYGNAMWYTPSADANVYEERTYGENLGLPVETTVNGAKPSEALLLVCEVRPLASSTSSPALLRATASAAAEADGSVTVDVPFTPTQMHDLAPGSYYLSISSTGSTHNQAIGQTFAGTLLVTASQPSVTGDVQKLHRFDDGTALDVAAGIEVSGLFEPALGADAEFIPLTCSIEDATDATLAVASTQAALDGTVPFTFSAAQMSGVEPGSYTLHVASVGSTHNQPIDKTAVGTLEVTTWHPRAVANAPLSASRAYGDAESLEVPFQLSDAHAEDMTIAVVLRKDGVDMPDEMVPTRGDGDYVATFEGYALAALEPGVYDVVAYTAGSLGNQPIEDSSLGTVSITKRQPFLLPGSSETYLIGSGTSQTVSMLLQNAAGDAIDLTCSLVKTSAGTELAGASLGAYADAGAQTLSAQDAATSAATMSAQDVDDNLSSVQVAGTAVATTTATITGSGQVTFEFSAQQMAQLAQGTYAVEVSATETAHNQALAATQLLGQTVTVSDRITPIDPDDPDDPNNPDGPGSPDGPNGRVLPYTGDTCMLPGTLATLFVAALGAAALLAARSRARNEER